MVRRRGARWNVRIRKLENDRHAGFGGLASSVAVSRVSTGARAAWAALQTASAIGDDRLEKEAQGYVVPDSFTHGTSEQRKRWFSNGFKEGQVSACDTISAATL